MMGVGPRALRAQDTINDHAPAVMWPHPTGYLGVTFTCPLRRHVGPSGVMLTHYQYPVVESVEPGSPAQQAGISTGDTILSYDSQDLLGREISLNTLLRPGARVAVALRRNGAVRTVRVRVATRPRTFTDSSFGAPPSVPPPPALPLALPLSRREATVAGAALVQPNADMRDALGIEHGLLVVDVGTGTPADAAGMRAGDVIVSVGGDSIREPATLLRAMAVADGRELSLSLVRHHKPRVVVLRW